MSYLPRPAFYPVPVGQVPPAGYANPHAQPNFPGFPPGFPRDKYARHVTPETMRFSLPPDAHHMWRPPASAAPSEEEEDSEEESDSDESSIIGTPPHLEANFQGWNHPRGRSSSRPHVNHTGRSASHSIPREQLRRFSMPQEVNQHHLQRNSTPYAYTQPLLTPFNHSNTLPLSPQHQPQPLFDLQQHHYATHPPAQAPHGYSPYIRTVPDGFHMPMTPRQPMQRAEHPLYYAAPQPEVYPKPQEKKRSRSMPKVAPLFRRAATMFEQFTQGPANPQGMIPNPKWGLEALRQRVIDPTRVSSNTLKRVLLHPLLAPGCRDLMILNTIRPPAALTATGSYSLQDYFSHPATAPPMNQFTIWTGVHEHPFTIVNPQGVTIANVLGCIGEMMFSKLKRVSWNAFSEQRRTEVANWFHHNRKVGLMPPAEQGIRCADLLGANTMFFGMEQLPDQPAPPGTFMIRWGPPI